MEAIVVALITGGLSLAGVIVSNISSNRSVESKLERAQAVTDTKLDELTREVREHNNFARRMPVVESQVASIVQKVDRLESFHMQTPGN
jgi:hypothetical protein